MNKVNEIIICRDSFDSQEEFEKSILNTTMALLNNNYIVVTDWDEQGLGILRLSFNYANREYGDIYPYWLKAEQVEALECECTEEEWDD